MCLQGSYLPSVEGVVPQKFVMYPKSLQTFLYRPIYKGYKTKKLSQCTYIFKIQREPWFVQFSLFENPTSAKLGCISKYLALKT